MTESGKHMISMEDRHNLNMTGVLHVESFDDGQIILETNMGVVILEGESLNINHLNLEKGDLLVSGSIRSLCYVEGKGHKAKGSLWQRLMK
ncbi:MAG: sporulation protein YabP [Bacillota bacterium]